MKEEVQELLDKMKMKLNKKNSFILSDRDKNNSFCSEYSLSSKIIKKILKNLTIFDFAKVMDNCHKDYVDEKLYLFEAFYKVLDSTHLPYLDYYIEWIDEKAIRESIKLKIKNAIICNPEKMLYQ